MFLHRLPLSKKKLKLSNNMPQLSAATYYSLEECKEELKICSKWGIAHPNIDPDIVKVLTLSGRFIQEDRKRVCTTLWRLCKDFLLQIREGDECLKNRCERYFKMPSQKWCWRWKCSSFFVKKTNEEIDVTFTTMSLAQMYKHTHTQIKTTSEANKLFTGAPFDTMPLTHGQPVFILTRHM